MKWKLAIRPAARQEFDEASDWYRDKDPEVRNRFVAAVRKTLTGIRQRPQAYPVVFGSTVRRAVVNRFPYSVYFLIDNDLVVVISVFHDSRNPIIWRGRNE